jgi:LacI family transcriptional regulator
MPIKLKDVARKSGYSITTVSRALAGYSDVNEETRKHIHETAANMGYQPNLVARQLRSQRTHTIGLIIPAYDQSFSNDFFSRLLVGIGDAAARARYDLLISAQAPGEEEMAAYRRMVGGNRVDGVILARTRRNDPRIAYLLEKKIPFAVSGRSAPDERSNFNYIDVDSRTGIRDVVEHFVSLGHQHIGLILPPDEMAFTDYRHNGYREGLHAHGIPYRHDYVTTGDLLRGGGEIAANNLLSDNPQLTAIVACNDLMAFGAMTAVEKRGLKVGMDIAIAGFDDIPAAEYAQPPLTTVHQPIYEIGLKLVDILLPHLRGETAEVSAEILPYTLMVRASSGVSRTKEVQGKA